MKRRGPVAAAMAMAMAMAMALGLAVTLAGVAAAQPVTIPPPPNPVDVAGGRSLFEISCTSCHGADARGTAQGPSLLGVGAASADFFLSTGRMPLDRPRAQAERKRPAFPPEEIALLTAYVASLGTGPPVPTNDPSRGDLAAGYQLYADNCASCHSSAGAGGALGHAVYAPPLNRATARQVAEAIRIGPGAMPVFGPDTFDDHEVDSIVRYVVYLRDPRDEGGIDLGHLGPLSEGMVAWAVGLLGVLLAARWIGTQD
ncbi:MAG: ubiquinol-cytochrome c reductase cytochrome c subunit [Actinomycetota bacterium]|jgi:ubiquinol-cytochrome c reductase cytochrome c subunit|nr:ubiquinol-cytochrome c reductase cytochrome c subunit [Actinomycetota bacterium]